MSYGKWKATKTFVYSFFIDFLLETRSGSYVCINCMHRTKEFHNKTIRYTIKSINFAHSIQKPPFTNPFFILSTTFFLSLLLCFLVCVCAYALTGRFLWNIDSEWVKETEKNTQRIIESNERTSKLKCTHNDNKFFDKLALKWCPFIVQPLNKVHWFYHFRKAGLRFKHCNGDDIGVFAPLIFLFAESNRNAICIDHVLI